jgi:tricorn protease
MHGVDWKRLRDRYANRLEGVGTPQEFADLLSMMVGEVNASHSEINAPFRVGSQTASLGLDFDTTFAGPGLKVSKVREKGPADKPSARITPGEYILSVDGTDVTRLTEDYATLLTDKAGKTVELLVNSKPTKEGARTVKVKPVASGELLNLDYEAEVKKNRERVERLSDGRLAYLHIRGMDQPSLRRFERELYSDSLDKEGLVLDVRGNGGGNTHDALLNILSRRVYAYQQPRDGLRLTEPKRAFQKPIVLLVNEKSASDAEMFPSGFRTLGLGKIVGVTTPGYVIGTYDGTLVNGVSFRLPTWAWYGVDGKNLENLGIVPDITVENTPEDTAAGKDRQLEVAVQTVLTQVAARSDSATSAGENITLSGANANPNGGSSEARPPKKTGNKEPGTGNKG